MLRLCQWIINPWPHPQPQGTHYVLIPAFHRSGLEAIYACDACTKRILEETPDALIERVAPDDGVRHYE